MDNDEFLNDDLAKIDQDKAEVLHNSLEDVTPEEQHEMLNAVNQRLLDLGYLRQNDTGSISFESEGLLATYIMVRSMTDFFEAMGDGMIAMFGDKFIEAFVPHVRAAMALMKAGISGEELRKTILK